MKRPTPRLEIHRGNVCTRAVFVKFDGEIVALRESMKHRGWYYGLLKPKRRRKGR